MSVELERTTNGQVRIKFSTEPNSTFYVNTSNISVYADPLNVNLGTQNLYIVGGTRINYNIKLSDISTINGTPSSGSLEDTLELIANEVFGGA